MLGFMKKRKDINKISSTAIIARDEAVSEVYRQYAIFFEQDEISSPPLQLFFSKVYEKDSENLAMKKSLLKTSDEQSAGAMSFDHMLNTAAYTAGFISGFLQRKKAPEAKMKKDNGLRYFSICSAAYFHIFGEDYELMCNEQLAAIDKRDANWMQLDKYGGIDGVRHADNQPKQYGGLLLHYLKNNFP